MQGALRYDDDDRVVADEPTEVGKPLLGRFRDRDHDVAVLDASRERFDPAGVVARQAHQGVALEPDAARGDVVQAPLLGKEHRHVVLGSPTAAHDDLAEAFARVGGVRESLVDLSL